MPKCVCVPRFVPPWSSSQGNGAERDQTEHSCPGQGDRGGRKKRLKSEKTRAVLKVKFTKFGSRTLREDKKEDRTPIEWILEPTVEKIKEPEGAETSWEGARPYSDSTSGDVFNLSQSYNNKPRNEKEKAKFAVLRNISRMLEENNLIRQRLDSLSQATCSSSH